MYLIEPGAFAPVSPTALVISYNDNPAEELSYHVYHYDAGLKEWKKMTTVNNTNDKRRNDVIVGGGYYAVFGDDTQAPMVSGLAPADGSVNQPDFRLSPL